MQLLSEDERIWETVSSSTELTAEIGFTIVYGILLYMTGIIDKLIEYYSGVNTSKQ